MKMTQGLPLFLTWTILQVFNFIDVRVFLGCRRSLVQIQSVRPNTLNISNTYTESLREPICSICAHSSA